MTRLLLVSLVFLLNQAALAFDEAHPYVYLDQTQLNTLRALVKSGADDYITRTYSKMKAYGDASLGDAPTMQSDGSDFLVNYRQGLVDTEKATAWAVSYHVENDMQYAIRARDYVIHYMNVAPNPLLLDWVSWKINILIIYDLTRPAGVYSANDIALVHNFIASRAEDQTSWCEIDPSWRENMSHWVCGFAAIAAMMYDDQNLIDRAFAQFQRRLDNTGPDGRFADFDSRGDQGLGYNIFSLSPLLLAAQTAKHTGRDWWSYSNNGRSLTNSVDFLTTAASNKPGDTWIPSIYGNGQVGPHSETTGDYADTLPQKILTDQRYLFEVAQNNRPKAIYDTILNDSSSNRNPRDDLYNYHAHYWLATFLNVGTSGPSPTRPNSPANLLIIAE